MSDSKRMFIGGEWVQARGNQTRDAINPDDLDELSDVMTAALNTRAPVLCIFALARIFIVRTSAQCAVGAVSGWRA